jgi:hypothetical protein
MVVAQEGNDLRVIDAGKSKVIGVEDARTYLLMVSASTGVPETYLTMDPSTGNLATAKEISPVFLTMIEERQTAWKDALTDIFRYILETDAFEVSFSPIRDNLQQYVNNVNAFARTSTGAWTGAVRAKDYIKAAHEALEWKLPPEDELDEMADALVSSGAISPEEPVTDDSLAQLAIAAAGLAEAAKKG